MRRNPGIPAGRREPAKLILENIYGNSGKLRRAAGQKSFGGDTLINTKGDKGNTKGTKANCPPRAAHEHFKGRITKEFQRKRQGKCNAHSAPECIGDDLGNTKG